MRSVLGVAVVGVLVLGAGCGGDDDDDADKNADATAYVEALAEQMSEEREGMELDETTASCFAESMVDAIGVDNLKAADVSPEDFADSDAFSDLDVSVPDDAATKVSDGLEECDAVGMVKEALIASFASDFRSELPQDASDCLSNALDDKALADATAATLVDGSSDGVETILFAAIGECPAVASEIVLSGAPADLSEDEKNCIRTFVEDNPEVATDAIMTGDQASSEALGTQLAAACPEAFAD